MRREDDDGRNAEIAEDWRGSQSRGWPCWMLSRLAPATLGWFGLASAPGGLFVAVALHQAIVKLYRCHHPSHVLPRVEP